MSHASPLAQAFVARAREAGARVVLGDGAEARPLADAHAEAFGELDPAHGTTLLTGSGHGSQQHVALAAAGAQLIVAFTALDDGPVGSPICPVLAVAGPSDLHRAIADDFDLGPDASLDALWSSALAALAGAQTAAEARGSRVFALERLAMCM